MSEKRRAEKEMLEGLQKEAEAQRRLHFQDEFRKASLEVARAQAKKEAAEKSGLQKLRATNRARRLHEVGAEEGSFFGKLADYTRKNRLRREENLKRTAILREEAKKMREERQLQREQERAARKARSSSKRTFY